MRKTLLISIIAIALSGPGCQKELPLPTPPDNSIRYLKVRSDTFLIQAFYGQQRLLPPNVGTVIFPQSVYEVPPTNKLAFMSAYTGRNGYGDSAGTVKKNALNEYNGEFYNADANARPNATITIIPIGKPDSESHSVSADSAFAFAKFFKTSRRIAIMVALENGGAWEHRDTAANKQITVYQMNPLILAATESVETGLATRNGAEKLISGQREFYMASVNQRGMIYKPATSPDKKPVAWYPHVSNQK